MPPQITNPCKNFKNYSTFKNPVGYLILSHPRNLNGQHVELITHLDDIKLTIHST